MQIAFLKRIFNDVLAVAFLSGADWVANCGRVSRLTTKIVVGSTDYNLGIPNCLVTLERFTEIGASNPEYPVKLALLRHPRRTGFELVIVT